MGSDQGVAYVFSGRNGDKEELSKEELIETWKLEREGEEGVKEFSARFREVLSLGTAKSKGRARFKKDQPLM